MDNALIGIFLIPDEATCARSRQLASQYVTEQSEFWLQDDNIPHVSLYQAYLNPVSSIPLHFLEETLDACKEAIGSQSFQLSTIEPYAHGFLFWHIRREENPESFGRLLDSQRVALNLSRYLPFPEKEKADDDHDAAGTPQEVNRQKYGYALVGNEYLPHITLGFSRKFDGSSGERGLCDISPWTMHVKALAVAEMGRAYGEVVRILAQIEC